MATPDAGGPSSLPHVPLRGDSDSQSSTSDSTSGSDPDFGQSAAPVVCRWRTGLYYDRECSRYFDCPSHVVERALSEADQESVEQQPEEPEGTQSSLDPGAISPLSEGEAEAEAEDEVERTRRIRAQAPSPEELATTGRAAEGTTTDGRTHETAISQQGESSSSQPALALEPASGDFMASPVAIPEPASRVDGPVFGSQRIDLATTTPVPPLRLVSRPISRPAPVPATPSPIPPTPTERAPSEVPLPRWQPDSEATYCPICGTQFSIFVRKHHCRYVAKILDAGGQRLTKTAGSAAG